MLTCPRTLQAAVLAIARSDTVPTPFEIQCIQTSPPRLPSAPRRPPTYVHPRRSYLIAPPPRLIPHPQQGVRSAHGSPHHTTPLLRTTDKAERPDAPPGGSGSTARPALEGGSASRGRYPDIPYSCAVRLAGPRVLDVRPSLVGGGGSRDVSC